ncbi:GNAT family N-acetyltransferase [Nocardioides sp. CPCC 205120]|uniref:GNAT family N-acetyltransferase n=1 Tax=Nocardioides sp. CPCC 205120 TaxID=3406462 RepID=UPI003B50BD54
MPEPTTPPPSRPHAPPVIAAEPDVAAPDVVALLRGHLEEMHAVSPPESVHALDLDALRRPEVTFLTARDAGGALLGVVALKRLDATHGELKSMRTDPTRVRSGTGTALLLHVLDLARDLGLTRVSLETGTEPFFAPARALYARHGFVECPPFGDYAPDPLSVFLTRAL